MMTATRYDGTAPPTRRGHRRHPSGQQRARVLAGVPARPQSSARENGLGQVRPSGALGAPSDAMAIRVEPPARNHDP